jgi:uncharacterized membrane protein
MAKIVLLSVMLGTISIPIFSAMETNKRRGLFHAVSIVAAFNLLYLLVLLFIYPHLS